MACAISGKYQKHLCWPNYGLNFVLKRNITFCSNEPANGISVRVAYARRECSDESAHVRSHQNLQCSYTQCMEVDTRFDESLDLFAYDISTLYISTLYHGLVQILSNACLDALLRCLELKNNLPIYQNGLRQRSQNIQIISYFDTMHLMASLEMSNKITSI